MKAKDILKKKGDTAITISEESTVLEAIQLMNRHKIGSLLALNGSKRLSGIITERDILHECGKRLDQIGVCRVRDVMTKELIIGIPDDSIEYLMSIMSKNKIRHIPIMEEEKILGLVTIMDLVEHQLRRAEYKNRYMEEYIKG